MKKRVVAATVIASALVMSSCSLFGVREEPAEGSSIPEYSETGSGTGVETSASTTPTTTQTFSTAMETEFVMELPPPSEQHEVTDDIRNAACGNYLSVLDLSASDISAYNWMTVGNTLAQEYGFIAPDNSIPCAFTDVTGDGLEELIIMTAVNDMMAGVEVYSFDPSEGYSRIILSLQGVDVQAGNGGTYMFGTLDNGSFFVYLSSGNDEWYDDYSVFDYNADSGMMEQVGRLSMHEYPVNEGADTMRDYTVNGELISEDDFNSCRIMLLGHLTQILQYNVVADAQMIDAFNRVPCIAVPYENVREIIQNSIVNGG